MTLKAKYTLWWNFMAVVGGIAKAGKANNRFQADSAL
jgi:hypothetical protein